MSVWKYKPGQDSQDTMQCCGPETVGQIYIFTDCQKVLFIKQVQGMYYTMEFILSYVDDLKMGKQGRPKMVGIFSAERIFYIHSWCCCMSLASFVCNLQCAAIRCMRVVVSKGMFFQVWGHASLLERRLACPVKVGGSPAVSVGRVQVTSESSWLHQQVCYSGPCWGEACD